MISPFATNVAATDDPSPITCMLIQSQTVKPNELCKKQQTCRWKSIGSWWQPRRRLERLRLQRQCGKWETAAFQGESQEGVGGSRSRNWVREGIVESWDCPDEPGGECRYNVWSLGLMACQVLEKHACGQMVEKWRQGLHSRKARWVLVKDQEWFGTKKSKYAWEETSKDGWVCYHCQKHWIHCEWMDADAWQKSCNWCLGKKLLCTINRIWVVKQKQPKSLGIEGPSFPKKAQIKESGLESGDSGNLVDLKDCATQDITFALLGIQEEISTKTVVMQQQLKMSQEQLETLWAISSTQLFGRHTLWLWARQGSNESPGGAVKIHEGSGVGTLREGGFEAGDGSNSEWDQKRAGENSRSRAENDPEVE